MSMLPLTGANNNAILIKNSNEDKPSARNPDLQSDHAAQNSPSTSDFNKSKERALSITT
jgi:hypothetical protein